MKAVVYIDVPEFQIGQEVSVYFKDTMYVKGICKINILDKIKSKIQWHRDTIDRAISEDDLRIESMKDAYNNCLEIIDKYEIESERV